VDPGHPLDAVEGNQSLAFPWNQSQILGLSNPQSSHHTALEI